MANDMVGAVTEFAEQVGIDINGINVFLGKIAPDDAEPLTGKVLAIYGGSLLKYTGYQAANPGATYKAGNAAGTQTAHLINDPIFVLETPNTATAINSGETGVLELHVNGVLADSIDLAQWFSRALEEGNQTYTPKNSAGGKITVVSVGVYNNIWQKAVVRVNIAALDLREGYNTLQLKHTGVAGGDQASAVYEVVYDSANGTPSVSNLTLAIHDNTHPKYLSGVRYLGMGDAVKVGLTGAQLFKNSYLQNLITLSGLHGVAAADIAPDDTAVTGVSVPPNVADTLTLTDKVLTLAVAGQCSDTPRITATPRNPFKAGAPVNSAALTMPVSTLNTASDNSNEYFNLETFRLPNSWNFAGNKTGPFTGQWDSTQTPPAGNAKVGIVANNEHGVLSFGSGQPESFNRAFLSPAARGNLQLILEGVAGGVGQLGAGDINVTVQLPTQTAVLDAAKPYNQAAGVATDGNGCMVGSISYAGGNATINVDFGGKSTFDTNNVVYVRVWLRNANRTIKNIRAIWG